MSHILPQLGMIFFIFENESDKTKVFNFNALGIPIMECNDFMISALE